VLLCGAARGQAPFYSAAGIVNAANYAPGPFAPNDILTLFGTNLSGSSTPVSAAEGLGANLPNALGLISLYVANMPAPILFVSATQINFLLPGNLTPGSVPVFVEKQGVRGPIVNIDIVMAAPGLFPYGNSYALAVDWNNANAVITPDMPAHSGDVVILYATGLGTAGTMETGEVPASGATINNLGILKVTLGGNAVDPNLIQYAGLTPGWAGLYQINLVLPANIGTDPEICVAIGDQSSGSALRLAVR